MRPGWPTFNIQQALVKGDHVEWLADLSTGRDAKPFLLSKISTGVVMALPPFPYPTLNRSDVFGTPIHGLTPAGRRNVHPCQMMQGQNIPLDQPDGSVKNGPCLLAAGDYVLVASGVGDTVSQARNRAYRILEKTKAPASPFWRTDIGLRLKKQLPEIQKHGYATGLEF